MPRTDLPSGTVTFLFTDVEGSTRLLHELGTEAYAEALAEHRRLIRDACAAEGGVEVDTQGDAFFFAFPSAPGALAAAGAFTDALTPGPVQVRVGLHTGSPLLTEEGYVGDDVHLAARVAATGHGGQVVLSAATAELVSDGLTDLGEHRLKDIAEAVPVFQLGHASFPPLKTISNTNLPSPASSFLGREAELAGVLGRIEQGARLVTLTGPGGTGKTRLALEAASRLVGEYKAGVFWVGLASLRDPTLVCETIAQVLGAKDGLAEHIGERELLLLLDNLEQVIEAAPDLGRLLMACPNLALLVTSREVLRVQGEIEYPVPPLAEPEAVTLFCERSGLEPSEEIAELCARLDSLPLAVELAAARTRALSPAQILERLSSRLDLLKGGRDADPRQQTLRATIEWSYELLSPEEQRLFACLSVFAGGCTLEAAEEVADADLEVLQSLVEKSLLRFTPSDTGSRYWMLETIREFAFGLLDDGAVELVTTRAVQYLVTLAESEGAPLFAGRQGAAFARLEAEHVNVREMIALAVRAGQRSAVLELTAVHWAFWSSRHPGEARTWAEWATETRRDVEDNVWLAGVLGAAEVVRFGGDLERSGRLKTELLSELRSRRQVGEDWWEAALLADLADLALEKGDLETAVDHAEQSLAAREKKGLPTARALATLGDIAMRTGDLDGAEEMLSRAAAEFVDRGHDANYASTTATLAEVARRRGDPLRAEALLQEAIGRLATLDDRPVLGDCLRMLALAAADRGHAERAGVLWGAADAVFAAEGIHHELGYDEEAPDVPKPAREKGARFSYAEAVAYALEQPDP